MLGKFEKEIQSIKYTKLLSLFFVILILGICNAYSQTDSQQKVDQTYDAKIRSVENERKELAKEYRTTRSKKEVIEKARKLFVNSVTNKIIPPWYGTEWDFYGTTVTPKEGKIACGYFVTTVLRDSGFKVQRVSLAQQASENIIKSLTSATFIKRFRNAKIRSFVDSIEKAGEGIYIVGLDFHVGFIFYDGENVWFIHSSYGEPSEVIKEKAIESEILSSSKYRVTGKISADDNFILKWLNQTQFRTVRR